MSKKSKSFKTQKVKGNKKSRSSKQNENDNGDELRNKKSKAEEEKSKSKVKKKSKKTPVLGNVDYEPSLEESKEIIEKGRNGINEFKLAIFYIWLYKLFSIEPYSCATILEFVAKHYDYSKASFYRLLTQININFLIHGKYDPENHINEHICQKLKRYSHEMGDDFIKQLWEFLNTEQNEPITGILVEQYVAMFIKAGCLVPIHKYKAVGKDVSKLKDDGLSPSVRKIEKCYSDTQEPTNYDESTDEDDEFGFDEDGGARSENNDDPEAKEAIESVDSEVQEEKEETPKEDEGEVAPDVAADYFTSDALKEREIMMLNAANLHSVRVIKLLPLLSKLKKHDFLALQCFIDHVIAENL
jgi:hypothetical protein